MKVSVYSYEGILRFPSFCSECMKPNPDRSLTVMRADSKLISNTVKTTSVKVPICNSCYKPRRRMARTIGALIGMTLIFFGGLITYSLFGLIDFTLSIVGLIIFFISAIVHFNILYSSPVKLKSCSPRIVLQFKNPKYGEMFRAANNDYAGQSEIVKDK